MVFRFLLVLRMFMVGSFRIGRFRGLFCSRFYFIELRVIGFDV